MLIWGHLNQTENKSVMQTTLELLDEGKKEERLLKEALLWQNL